MKIIDYVSRTYGARVRGHLRKDTCFRLLLEQSTPDMVLIPYHLETQWHNVIVQPHPDCRAQHVHETEKWTTMHVRAFSGVDERHRAAVQSFGEKNRIVRMPIMEELTLDYIRGMA